LFNAVSEITLSFFFPPLFLQEEKKKRKMDRNRILAVTPFFHAITADSLETLCNPLPPLYTDEYYVDASTSLIRRCSLGEFAFLNALRNPSSGSIKTLKFLLDKAGLDIQRYSAVFWENMSRRVRVPNAPLTVLFLSYGSIPEEGDADADDGGRRPRTSSTETSERFPWYTQEFDDSKVLGIEDDWSRRGHLDDDDKDPFSPFQLEFATPIGETVQRQISKWNRQKLLLFLYIAS